MTATPTRTATPTATGTPTPTIGGAPWCDDFELGSFVRWTGPITGMVITSTDVHAGKFAARAEANGHPASAVEHFSATYSRLCARVFLKHISQAAGETDELLHFRTSLPSPIVTAFIGADGTLGYINHPGGVTRTSSLVVTKGVYHQLQICVRITGVRRVETYYDGQTVPELTRTEQTLGSLPVRELVLGDTRSGVTHHDVFDDIAAQPETPIT
jgi:hypothetical protein